MSKNKAYYVKPLQRSNLLYLLLFLLMPCGVQLDAQNYQNYGGKYNSSRISEFWQQIDDIFNDPNFSSSNWGVVIKSLETGEYFYKRNEDKLFMPASDLKLFTTAAGLLLLGPDYRYKTNVFVNGSIDGTQLKGDLYIQGSGDPTISGRFTHGDIYKVYNDWADSLIALGIDEISGNIIGDDNYFDDRGLGTGWAWDNESYWYSAPTSALSFNDNCVDILVRPGTPGNPAVVASQPETKYVTLINKVITGPNDSETDIDVYRERGTNIITVYGSIAANSDELRSYATVNNPTQYSMVVLKEVLKNKGITVRGYAADIDDETVVPEYTKMKKLFTHVSVALSDIIKITNKNSQNFYAEQLLKTIGLEEENLGTVDNGVKAVKHLFNNIGINSENMIITDGSGLSRLNLVTPKQIVELLSYMYKQDCFPSFVMSLPIAGVDGTLAKRMSKSKAERNVRAKTGYISGVRSLSGYAYTADNEPLVFSIIVNNYIVPSTLADNVQDLVCLRLANFSRK